MGYEECVQENDEWHIKNNSDDPTKKMSIKYLSKHNTSEKRHRQPPHKHN